MSAKVQHLEAHTESEATQAQRYEINVSDLEAVIEMAGLCRDARPGLDWVWVEAGDGELRIVATDAKVMGVARLYDTSTTPPARAVEGLTNWTPTPSGGVSYPRRRERMGMAIAGGRSVRLSTAIVVGGFSAHLSFVLCVPVLIPAQPVIGRTGDDEVDRVIIGGQLMGVALNDLDRYAPKPCPAMLCQQSSRHNPCLRMRSQAASRPLSDLAEAA